ncbi:hypothetical protein [Mycolicibacterium parafortuitum]|uniref:hypothetical protein n=1 Tax=Mycolicibacterium parafortuitum TaxID=39692 RepID=UPI00307E27F3
MSRADPICAAPSRAAADAVTIRAATVSACSSSSRARARAASAASPIQCSRLRSASPTASSTWAHSLRAASSQSLARVSSASGFHCRASEPSGSSRTEPGYVGGIGLPERLGVALAAPAQSFKPAITAVTASASRPSTSTAATAAPASAAGSRAGRRSRATSSATRPKQVGRGDQPVRVDMCDFPHGSC